MSSAALWRRASTGALLLCSLGLGLPVQAQSGGPPGVRGAAGGMATRSVSRYLQLERELQDRLAGPHPADAKALLDDNFTWRSAQRPDMLDAVAWLQARHGGPKPPRQVRDLTVQEVDDLAVVSFLLESPAASAGAQRAPTLFVVDVWRQSSGRLLHRATDTPAHAPRPLDRPSGKE
jgi:hypothetical protein